MLDRLPEDIQLKLLNHLSQPDHASIAQLNTSLHALAEPYLHRIYRCVTCQHHLFHPRLRLFNPIDRCTQPTLGVTSKLPPRLFFQIRDGHTLNLNETAILLDSKPGVPNFHVLRHLAQTLCKNGFPDVLNEVRALRCAQCRVFIGFRYGVDNHQYFVHQHFVELIDRCSNPITISGHFLTPPEKSIRCATLTCQSVLFDRDDMLPWSHVLSSSRLLDLDAYLEWDHSWAGSATAHQPAFFVKRLRQQCCTIQNVRQERLRQGEMIVADVLCIACHRQIGWKFVEEVGANAVNYDQVGRFGIIRGSCTPNEPRHLAAASAVRPQHYC